MRFLLSALVALAMLVPVAGVSAAEGVEPCGAPTMEGATVLTADGAEETFAPSATPAFGHDILVEVDPSSTYSEDSVVSFTYQFDLSAEAVDGVGPNRGTLDIDLDWDDDISDFDMYIKDADGDLIADGASNTLFKEYVDGQTGEQATLSLNHCQEIEIEVVNYSGSPAAELQMDLGLRNLK